MLHRFITPILAPAALAALIAIIVITSAPAAPTLAQSLTTPQVSAVALTSDAGDNVYAIDDDITVTVTFSENISVTGKPEIEIDVGGNARDAVYRSHSGTDVLFTYTVAENDQDDDGVSIAANKLSEAGGTIQSAGGVTATLTHNAVSDQASHTVDGVRPIINTVAHTSGGSADDIYVTGDQIVVNLNFSEEVLVTGAPQLALDLQNGRKTAAFLLAHNPCGGPDRDPNIPCLQMLTPGTRQGHLTNFSYIVAEGDHDANGFAIPANAVSLNGGAIKDAAGNTANLDHAAVADDPRGIIDAVGPTISSIAITSDAGDDNTYGPGDAIMIQVTFSELLTINGGIESGRIPAVALTLGDNTRAATFRTVSGTTLGFSYTVRPDDEDTDGISIPANPIILNGSTILDRANPDGRNNPADLTYAGLPAAASHKVSPSSPKGSSQQQDGISIKGLPMVGKTLSIDTSQLEVQKDDGETAADTNTRTSKSMSVDVSLAATLAMLQPENKACASYRDPQPHDPTAHGHADESDAMTIAWLTPNDNGYTVLQSSTDTTYTVTDDDIGKSIMAAVQYTDSDGQEQIRATVPTPVITQDTSPVPVWTATLNLGSATDFLGYTIYNARNGKPVPTGTLSPDTFQLDGATHTISAFGILKGTLIMTLRPKTTADFTLNLGDASFSSKDATNRESAYLYQFRWNDHDLDWSADDDIAVTLTTPEANTPANGEPTISGTPQVRETLSADVSAIADADGIDNAVFTYRWFAVNGDLETEIPDQTGATLNLADDHAGKTIRLTVDFSDDASNEESRTSEPTTVIQATTPTPPRRPAVAAGSASGELTATWQPPSSNGGSSITSYQVQWKAATASWDTSADVSQASTTATSHTITALTAGARYSVRVAATNGQGTGPHSTEATGAAAEQTAKDDSAAKDTNTAPTGAPTISGTPQVEETLTADTSAIKDPDGLTNVSYKYQWIADGADISGATGSSLTLTTSQQGKTIKVKVDFDDDQGNSESLTSAATKAVTPRPVLLTAAFSGVPDSHTGANFTFTLTFSENVKAGFRKIRDHAFTLDEADITAARRTHPQGDDRNRVWTITVKVDDDHTGAVTLTLPETTDCGAAGAICTFDDRMLSHSTSVSVPGPK